MSSVHLPMQAFPRVSEIVPEETSITAAQELSRQREAASCLPKGEDDAAYHTSLSRSTLIIATLAGITMASSMTTGFLVVQLPVMAKDLGLSDRLLLW